jgi:hypothetical protein
MFAWKDREAEFGGLNRQQISSEGAYSAEGFGAHASGEIYAGLGVSSYKVALYRSPLLTSVVSSMTVPCRSVENNHRPSLSTRSNFSRERSTRVGEVIGRNIRPVLRRRNEPSCPVFGSEWIDHQNKTDHRCINRIPRQVDVKFLSRRSRSKCPTQE